MRQSWFGLLMLMLVSGFLSAQDYKTYDDGIARYKAGEYQVVIDKFSGLLAEGERNKKIEEDLYFYRGLSYYNTHEYQKSLYDLEKSLALNHYNKGTIYWYMARCHDKLAKQTEAISNYKLALTAAEKNRKLSAQILADRAQYFSRQGDAAAAQQDLAQAKTLDPNNPEIASASLKKSAATPTTRTAGEEKKTTQVIVKNNPTSETKPQSNQPQVQQNQSVHTGLVPALSSAYKDEKRYALIIGNSNYPKEIGMLRNPVNDATDIATELRNSDFEVQLLTNATYVQIREAVRKFHDKLTNGPKDQTVGLFYYAGHGVQYQDENYLVPIDAKVQFEDDVVRMCFPVQRMVLANMERSNSRMNIVILDACRNNPFPATSRGVDMGLAEMKRARGSFIAYATAPGSVASDGTGRNGLYTQELLKALRKPGLTIEQVFKEVRMNVLRLSGDKQYTWDSSNIVGEFFFKLQ
ncbi:MAG: caspase family protein [Cyclobacteriaceae bacterium]|nr:caspase family protein [Cyclobacteriaceae bacterium]